MSNLKVILGLLLAFGTAQAALNPPHTNAKKGMTNRSSYPIGGDQIRFGWHHAAGCDSNSLARAAVLTKHQAKSFICDDQWYEITVPPGRCAVLSYYNVTTDKMGWAAVQNKPSSWAFRSHFSNWSDYGNGDKQKYTFNINGATIDIDLFNPYNQAHITGDDVLFGFDDN